MATKHTHIHTNPYKNKNSKPKITTKTSGVFVNIFTVISYKELKAY